MQINIREFDPFGLTGKRHSLYLAGLCTNLHNIIAAALDQFPVVGDHENGSAVPRFASQPFRDEAHILPVKAAGGLIENQYPAAGKDGAGNGKPLLLSAGQGWTGACPCTRKGQIPSASVWHGLCFLLSIRYSAAAPPPHSP